ncbi:hypothetical protein PV396_25930 [Streptomyces sp. ME02-8801-2C]|uniref:hypothetical protein n=1 Tax=Streptomyces sp. ME02-8801-2C TaxID=3028680 RepID=UPI0029AA5A14|nr:hypothetical protein [Streptomyces sp. ME02-8801-2C]MDX3455336.1 hypothetical protein [Streptomyces sp. ME02-8801-2C]
MQKRTAGAVIGAAVAGTCLALTMQGSAQATPAAPVAEQATTVSKGADKAPQAVASAAGRAATRAAGRATVHARAAGSSLANAAGALTDNLSLGGLFSEPANISGEVSDSTAFDR